MYYYILGVWLLMRLLHDVAAVVETTVFVGKGVMTTTRYISDKIRRVPKLPEEIEMNNIFTVILPEEEVNHSSQKLCEDRDQYLSEKAAL